MFAVRRAEIESFARELEARGRARATVTRRLCTIAGFYRYAVEEELLDHSPAAHVRRPRVDYESHAVALDRNELGALLVAAGLGPPCEHALISLLALNGLRSPRLESHIRVPEVIDEARTATEQHRNDVQLELVQQSRCQVLLSDVAADEALCAACSRRRPGIRSICGNSVDNRGRGTPRRLAGVVGEVLSRRSAMALSAVSLASARRRRWHGDGVLGEGARLTDAAALAALDEMVSGETAGAMERIEVLAGADPSRSSTRSCVAPCTTRCRSPNATPRTVLPPVACDRSELRRRSSPRISPRFVRQRDRASGCTFPAGAPTPVIA